MKHSGRRIIVPLLIGGFTLLSGPLFAQRDIAGKITSLTSGIPCVVIPDNPHNCDAFSFQIAGLYQGQSKPIIIVTQSFGETTTQKLQKRYHGFTNTLVYPNSDVFDYLDGKGRLFTVSRDSIIPTEPKWSQPDSKSVKPFIILHDHLTKKLTRDSHLLDPKLELLNSRSLVKPSNNKNVLYIANKQTQKIHRYTISSGSIRSKDIAKACASIRAELYKAYYVKNNDKRILALNIYDTIQARGGFIHEEFVPSALIPYGKFNYAFLMVQYIFAFDSVRYRTYSVAAILKLDKDFKVIDYFVDPFRPIPKAYVPRADFGGDMTMLGPDIARLTTISIKEDRGSMYKKRKYYGTYKLEDHSLKKVRYYGLSFPEHLKQKYHHANFPSVYDLPFGKDTLIFHSDLPYVFKNGWLFASLPRTSSNYHDSVPLSWENDNGFNLMDVRYNRKGKYLIVIYEADKHLVYTTKDFHTYNLVHIEKEYKRSNFQMVDWTSDKIRFTQRPEGEQSVYLFTLQF